ncbi:urokinase plasminogen activator surface receptor isoform X4 [Enhydra lutris kenyoni]|uniref:Urokinase plasminogen activator surface receptor n=1 Tax=Enhydra lutris kenyoni TaxID=391180 RepID=A0A2Y9IG01_ENHLU|nr:urokinase plasminogen activator surface receptor isoform X4 [Enhydra lutris kenyoni]
MGRPKLLPLLLLLVQTCVPASWSLQCLLCGRTGKCQVEECAHGQDLCRTTTLRIWEGGEELEVVERGCAHPEKSNRTMSYRTGTQIITLTEALCATDLCNRPSPGRTSTFPRTRSRYLECVSCASSDLSCERGWDQSLQCRSPTEQCVEVVTHRSLEGETGSPRDEHHTRGCGNLPGCPGPAGFHNHHTFHFLQCCNTTKCNGGSGLGNPIYTVRGCATPSWCQSLHVAEAFSLTHLNVSCCTGTGCNHPVQDHQPRMGGAPRPGPAHLSLTTTLLITARLWGGTLLWT